MKWRAWFSKATANLTFAGEAGGHRRSHFGLLLALASSISALVFLTLALVWNLNQAQDQQSQTQWWRAHTLNVLLAAERIDTALNEALRGESDVTLTVARGAPGSFERGMAGYRDAAGELMSLTRDNAAQQRRLIELDRHVRTFESAARMAIASGNHGRTAAAIAAARADGERQSLQGAGRILGEIKLQERRLLATREASERESAQRARRFSHLILGAAGLLLALLTAAVTAMLRSRDRAFRAMAEVRERERLYRLLADNTNDMIVRIGLDGTRHYVSPACRSLLGYGPEEMVGGTPVAAIHVEDRARVIAVCNTLLSGAQNPICSYRQQHRDGHYVWLEASYRLIRDDRGEPIEFVASVRDIGTRQLAEREAAIAAARLQENNRLFAMAASLAHVGHWQVDLVRDEVVWADEVRLIHAVADDYVPTLQSAIDFYHPDDRDRVATFIQRAAEEGEAFAFAATLIRADGEIGNVTVRGQAERAPNGDIIGLFGVVQDISKQVAAETALRSSERMHRLLAEASTDIIVRFALDGTPLYVSPACHAVLGFTPEEMMVRGAVRDIHPDDRTLVLNAWERVVRGETTEICLYRQRRKDGGEVWLEAAYRLTGGEATGGEPEVVATVRDVSRRRHAELAMAETADRLQESNVMLAEARERAEMAARTKANFLANMSHEIRTPMNGVVGFTDLMLQGELSDDQRRRAELIADSGRSMVRLLNDILDLSKIEAGQMTVAAAPYDIAHALRACAKLVRPAIEQKGVALRYDLSESLPEMVLGDGLRVRQIVLNLLGNAAKFTTKGEIILSARVNWRAAGAVLMIGVEDTGIGIAVDRQAAIFEEFVQADASITPQFGGTGLGLAISARLARLMGGELQLESEVGRGSRFSLVLPLTVATRPEGPVGRAVPALAPAPALTRSAHVLVAEDHDINQILIGEMLDRLGCSHALATDGREAVRMVAAASAAGKPFSIVLMDVQMPHVDGLEATRRIRAAGFDAAALPIVALTANAYAEDVAVCLDAGMQAHLCKPVLLEDLGAMLNRWGAQPALAPAVAGPRPTLDERYRNRKQEMLARLEALAGGDQDAAAVSTVADLLHKLAGTAAMFGEAELGEIARQLEHDLGEWPEVERSQRVRAVLPALRAAA